jgi:hypothetical protein
VNRAEADHRRSVAHMLDREIVGAGGWYFPLKQV